jgi:hypothetical protein
VVSGHPHDVPRRGRRRNTEGVPLALYDERRHCHGVELGQPALLGLTCAAGRLERERQAENAGRAYGSCRATRNTPAQRATAHDQRQVGQLVPAKALDDRDPCRVELFCRGGGAAAGDAVRLLDERDADSLRTRGVPRGYEIGCVHPARSPMPEHERSSRPVDRMEMGARGAVRGVDADCHATGSNESTLGVSPMRYLVIETYVGGAEAVYARSAQQGRMLPTGLAYVDSWVDAETLERCFQLMETDEPSLFDEWIANWNDIVDFQIVPVISSSEAAKRSTAD